MRKMIRWVLMPCLLICGAWLAFSQMSQPPGMPGNAGDFQKALKMMKKESPELYEFEKRLSEIREECQKIGESYAKKEITKAAAKAKLLPLIKEEMEIQNDPEYMVEKMLLMPPPMQQGVNPE